MNLIANKKSKQPRRTIPAANNAIPMPNTSGLVEKCWNYIRIYIYSINMHISSNDI